MFETSRDIFFIAVSGAIVAVAVFICIAMAYLIGFLKRGYGLTKGWGERFKKVDEILDLIKSKVNGSISSLAFIGNGVKQLLEFFRKKKEKTEEEVAEEKKK
jgi:hypothetical protein